MSGMKVHVGDLVTLPPLVLTRPRSLGRSIGLVIGSPGPWDVLVLWCDARGRMNVKQHKHAGVHLLALCCQRRRRERRTLTDG